VEDFIQDTGVKFNEIDVCGLAFEYVLQEARQEIEEATGIDICIDTEVYTYFNYMCSCYDRREGALEAAKKVEEPSALLQAFISVC